MLTLVSSVHEKILQNRYQKTADGDLMRRSYFVASNPRKHTAFGSRTFMDVLILLMKIKQLKWKQNQC